MTTEPIRGELRTLLAQATGAPADAIGPGFDCTAQAGWTSLKGLMLLSQLERRFGVTFSNAEIPQLTTFDAIGGAIARHLGAGAGA